MFEHLSYDEFEDLWKKIHKRLKEPFPPGSVKIKDNKSQVAYIPARVYVHRLNEVAGPVWSWRITKERVSPVVELYEVNGVLKILNREIEGQGFARININNNGLIANYENAVRAAANDALRNACDRLEMGWGDLAPYRDWADNPGVGIEAGAGQRQNQKKVARQCVRCDRPLTEEEVHFLHVERIPINYCSEHVPMHLKRAWRK